jgi:hypothetical protein
MLLKNTVDSGRRFFDGTVHAETRPSKRYKGHCCLIAQHASLFVVFLLAWCGSVNGVCVCVCVHVCMFVCVHFGIFPAATQGVPHPTFKALFLPKR